MPKTLLDFFGSVPKKPKMAASPSCNVSTNSPSSSKTPVVAQCEKKGPAAFATPPRPKPKSPAKPAVKAKAVEKKTPTPKPKPPVKGKENDASSDDEEKEQLGSKRRHSSAAKSQQSQKRRRLIVESDSEEEKSEDEDSSEDEYVPGEEPDVSEESESGEAEDESSSASASASPSPPKAKRTAAPKSPASATASPAVSTPSRAAGRRVSDVTKGKLSSFAAADDGPDEDVTANGGGDSGGGGTGDGPGDSWDHLSCPFLQPKRIRDAENRRPDHEDYDERTLFVPSDFLAKCTPGMRQWWQLKSKHFDTILFFKVGKFYELYHMDAVTAVNELGLIYMKGSFAHSGFPEIAYGRMANRLIEKGYKVARVEQTETPEQMAERTRGRPGKEKVVRREICQISTPGARSLHARSGDLSTDVGLQRRQFLLALKERPCEGGSTAADGDEDCAYRFGVAFVDTSEGKIQVGEFFDDRQCSRLRTLFAHYPPAQVLTERHNLSAHTQHLLNNCLSACLKERLAPKKEFWDAERTLLFLGESGHYGEDDFALPACLRAMLDEADSLGRTVHPDHQLGVSALGGLVSYLRRCLLDAEVLSMRRIEAYRPIDCQLPTGNEDKEEAEVPFYERQQHMILDGITLANLDVLVNSGDGSTRATLMARLDTCVTPFGRRLLQAWVCSPLCRPQEIAARQDAVEDLMRCADAVQRARDRMRKLPDLEKLLTRVHVLGWQGRDAEQPDSRAILYEEVVYSKWKIKDLLTVLRGFSAAVEVAQELEDEFSAPACRALVCRPDEGEFPDLAPLLAHFQNAFDQERAQREGKITPEAGVDEDFDEAVAEMKETQAELDEYLREQSRRLGCKMTFWGSGRNRFQLEVPDSHAGRVPGEFALSSQRKGVKRYKTPTTERLLLRLAGAEERKDSALRSVMRRIFEKLDREFATWWAAMRCLARLDALMALAEFSRGGGDGGEMCRPEVEPGEAPMLEIRAGRHPCLTATFLGGDFIPNDTLMGAGDGPEWSSPFLLVTGPNMGGKSTLMRQTALLVLLAQLGCYVPASRCRFTPIDRIFTRLGASDRIMAGESTFLVELGETAAMLRHATAHSLVLLDELGRGTATYDGTAIASAVVKDLLGRVRCRALFSTHYHGLVEAFAGQASLGHMACLVGEEGEEEGGIVFLYSFQPGACPKSYGFNAARLAALPDQVVRRGFARAREMERETALLRFCREVQTKALTNKERLRWRSQFEELKVDG